jgi:hypothetical protein
MCCMAKKKGSDEMMVSLVAVFRSYHAQVMTIDDISDFFPVSQCYVSLWEAQWRPLRSSLRASRTSLL